MKFLALKKSDRRGFADRIAALEADTTYPYGDDRFQLDHGADYFAFFDRLGDVLYAVALDGDEVVAVGCGVLRRIPIGGELKEAWYVCDLKVRPDHRGRQIPLRFLGALAPDAYLRCGRGYAISMNPPAGDNRVVRLIERFAFAPVRLAATLSLYTVDDAAMRTIAPLLVRRFGPIGYRSLAGVKDVVLESTGRPMPLWHLQHGPLGRPQTNEPQTDGLHMFSVVVGDAIAAELAACGLSPSAHASVVAHRLGGAAFDFVLTSDI
jgi:GNAT superfamily N-acetyltransferase